MRLVLLLLLYLRSCIYYRCIGWRSNQTRCQCFHPSWHCTHRPHRSCASLQSSIHPDIRPSSCRPSCCPPDWIQSPWAPTPSRSPSTTEHTLNFPHPLCRTLPGQHSCPSNTYCWAAGTSHSQADHKSPRWHPHLKPTASSWSFVQPPA